jgi:hypothetical protein
MSNDKNELNNIYINFYSGIIAGLVSNLLCNPFDVIRSNKQLSNQIHWNINFLSRGLFTGFITIPAFWSIYFESYEKLKQYNNSSFSFINGYISSNISSFITCPLFFIRLKNQTQNDFNLITFYKKNGIKPFYTGISQTMIINASFIIQMPIYEKFKNDEKFKKIIKNDVIRIFIISAVSKIIASCVFYPFDTIRSIKRGNHNLMEIDIIKKLNKKPIMYYSGINIYLLRGIPYYTSIFCTYEYTKKLLKN